MSDWRRAQLIKNPKVNTPNINTIINQSKGFTEAIQLVKLVEKLCSEQNFKVFRAHCAIPGVVSLKCSQTAPEKGACYWSMHFRKVLVDHKEIEDNVQPNVLRKEKEQFWFKYCDVNQYFGDNPYYLVFYRQLHNHPLDEDHMTKDNRTKSLKCYKSRCHNFLKGTKHSKVFTIINRNDNSLNNEKKLLMFNAKRDSTFIRNIAKRKLRADEFKNAVKELTERGESVPEEMIVKNNRYQKKKKRIMY